MSAPKVSREGSVAGTATGKGRATFAPGTAAAPRPTIAAKGAQVAGTKSQPIIRLPKCPEGQTMTANLTPCERPNQGKGTHRKRKTGFRVPLKKEDGNMESQIIEYNCEFPNRVVVRLEYLMQSTKVRLNDKSYMDDLYAKLLEEERRALQKATRAREKTEQNRMKKLIIDGVDRDIPPELSYLHRHPVFRVNQMLNRLKTFDAHLASATIQEGEEITPVEPYEYNGNKFFKHLHNEGDLWVPSAQEIFDSEKLEGKIQRAKLRLLMKRKEAEAEEKVLRILNNIAQIERERDAEAEGEDAEEVGGEEGDIPAKPKKKHERPSWLIEFEKERASELNEDAKLNKALNMTTSSTPFSTMDMAVDKIKANNQKELAKIQNRIKRSKDHEKAQEALLELKRHEQEIHYLDTFNYERARIIDHYEKRLKRGHVDDLLGRPDLHKPSKHERGKASAKAFEDAQIKSMLSVHQSGSQLPVADQNSTKASTPDQSAAAKHSPNVSKKNIKSTGKFGNEQLFNKLRKVYGVESSFPFHHYESYENEFLAELDGAEDGEGMMEAGENIADMYTRELMAADEYMKNREENLKKEKSKLSHR